VRVVAIVEARRADKANRNSGDSVTKCQDRSAPVCDIGLKKLCKRFTD
jgi:hypothetical protein